jgi:hypothetical protein
VLYGLLSDRKSRQYCSLDRAVDEIKANKDVELEFENRKNTDMAKFKEALTSYNKEIRRLKIQSFVRLSE